jgi:hemoglobin-like flavoprotein
MTPEQAALIRTSFDATWSKRRALADLCYSRLFELAPETRRLFADDMERQLLKLMDMLAALVGALDQRELFQSLISHSGQQHAEFGVQPSQYAAFGEALIWSIHSGAARRLARALRNSVRRNAARRRAKIGLGEQSLKRFLLRSTHILTRHRRACPRPWILLMIPSGNCVS